MVPGQFDRQPLIPELVREARRKELEYFNSLVVWALRLCEEAFQKQGKAPITVKWVDVRKGNNIIPQKDGSAGNQEALRKPYNRAHAAA